MPWYSPRENREMERTLLLPKKSSHSPVARGSVICRSLANPEQTQSVERGATKLKKFRSRYASRESATRSGRTVANARTRRWVWLVMEMKGGKALVSEV